MNQKIAFQKQIPQTEGIKYAGSKLKLLPAILEMIGEVSAERVFDGFAGSTRVSQALAKAGYQVHANDVSAWSKIFATCYLKNQNTPEHYTSLIEHLNHLKPQDGWFTEHYGGDVLEEGVAQQEDGKKRPWQRKNTRKLDAIREEIDRLSLDEVSKSVALASLVLALDKVDNTLGHFAAYLQKWSPRSYRDMLLEVPLLWRNEGSHRVTQADVFDVIDSVDADIAYYDPPYGSNNEKMPPSRVRYAAYYHLWTSIIQNDAPSLFGKASRRKDTSDGIAASVFEEFRKNEQGEYIVMKAIEELITQTPCEWIVFSYSSGGRATAHDLNEVMHAHAKSVKMVKINHRENIMAKMQSTQDWLRESHTPNQEFLFLIHKK